MALVPLEGEPAAREPGVLELTGRQVQQAGVRTALVTRRDLVREIDATGRLEVNPHRHRAVTSWIPGRSRIQRLHFQFTGETIRVGQVMAELYSPTLLTSLEEYRLAARAHESLRTNGTAEAVRSARQLLDSARERLLRFGLSAEQVRDLTSQGAADPASPADPGGSSDPAGPTIPVGPTDPAEPVEPAEPAESASSLDAVIPAIPIHAPLAGTLLEPAAVKEGSYVQEGDVLFHVADLSNLWLFVDVYEYELPFVASGQKVEVSTRAHPGTTFEGEISLIEPVVRERTRTARVRCVIDNREGKLFPGMYARVRLRSLLSERLAVPESAVLQSGRRDVAIASEGGGRYRPKLVRLGRRYLYATAGGSTAPSGPAAFAAEERYHEVLAGLAEGERVVVAGNFLLNAEAQFQGILKKMLAAAEAAERAPPIPAAVRARLDEILAGYLRLGAALVADRADGLAEPAREVGRLAAEAGDRLPEEGPAPARALLGRMGRAAEALVESRDLEEARRHFAALSREVIAYLRDFVPDRVVGGEFHVFRCPMANDREHRFGFDLWVQREREIANPYMGPSMPG